jgi:hypothetical protein
MYIGLSPLELRAGGLYLASDNFISEFRVDSERCPMLVSRGGVPI